MSFLPQALVFLAAAVVAVPLFKRFGLGSVLGYLAAGMVVGPWGIRAISDVESILHFAEFGVVLLLFLIGLELQPARLCLLNLGIKHVTREAGGSSLEMTEELLRALGLTYSESHKTLERFREHDEALLLATYPYHKDQQKLSEMAAQARAELESLFVRDTDEQKKAG